MPLALSKNELNTIHTSLGRQASLCELTVIDTMWSEHCSYKSTKPVLRRFPTKGEDVVLGVGEDAGIVHFTSHEGIDYGIAVSHESHNHPSQVLPIEGAATGVGGVVRDVYCMGADVFGVLNSLHFGTGEANSFVEEIAQRVVLGVSEYGNALGVPVLGGETLYHSSYNENCLVNVAALGLVDQAHIVRSKVPEEAKNEPFDVILVGKSTDATGFGGASFSSQILDADEQNVGAVQVHDPFLKRVLVDAFQELWKRFRNKPIGAKDLGAGGISCAASELAVAGGFGVELNLDLVNCSIAGLDAEVIACSETQERFCVVVPRRFSQEVLDLFNIEFEMPKLYHQAGAAVIGEIIEEQQFRMFHKQKLVCDLPVSFITTEVLAKREAAPLKEKQLNEPDFPTLDNLEELLLAVVSHPLCCSKRYVYRYYDQAVRGDTIAYPGEVDAVVTSPVNGSNCGCVVSMDSNLYGQYDAYLAGAAAVAESVRNVVAVGAKPLALTDCLNYGNPEDPEVFLAFQEGVRGISEAAEQLSFKPGAIPIISGNVSLYNQSSTGCAVVPSPVVCCIGKLEDISSLVKQVVLEPEIVFYRLGEVQAKWAGTVIADVLQKLNRLSGEFTEPFAFRASTEHAQNLFVHRLIKEQLLVACHDISFGGPWQSVLEMLLGERAHQDLGFEWLLNHQDNETIEQQLFAENGGFILALKPENELALLELYQQQQNLCLKKIGYSKQGSKIVLKQHHSLYAQLEFQQLKEAYNIKNKGSFGTPI